MTSFDRIKADLFRLTAKPQPKTDDRYVLIPKGQGSVIVRLLPALSPDQPPYQWTRLHYLPGRTVHCPREQAESGYWTAGPACPVCVEYNRLWGLVKTARSDRERAELEAAARALKPVPRWYWNCVVIRDAEGKDRRSEGAKVLSVGKLLHQKILASMLGDPAVGIAGIGDVTDVATGRNLLIANKPKGGYPEYGESQFFGSEPLANADAILATRHDLSGLRKVASHAELAAAISGTTPAAPADDADTSVSADDYLAHLRATVA